MPISIKNEQAEALAREVARETGESITTSILVALEERLARLRGRRTVPHLIQQIMQVSERAAALPDHDQRSEGEVLGYGPDGTFEPDGH